jgi:hypothetical protein
MSEMFKLFQIMFFFDTFHKGRLSQLIDHLIAKVV